MESVENTMTITIERETAGRSLLEQVKADSGVDINLCLQCRRCSNGCPAAEFTGASPSEIIRKLQLGADKEVLNDEFIWVCASCETCFERCPMKINMAGVVDSLRIRAAAEKAETPSGNMPLINKTLLGTMKSFGRTYDLGAMILYKAKTFSYFRDAGKFPMILKKGKIALIPSTGGDKKTVKLIFKNIEKMRKH